MPSGVKKVEVDVQALNGYLVFIQDQTDRAREVIELLTISNKIKDFLLIYSGIVKDTCLEAQKLLLP